MKHAVVIQDQPPILMPEIIQVIVGVATMIHQLTAKNNPVWQAFQQCLNEIATPNITITLVLAPGNIPAHGDAEMSLSPEDLDGLST